MTNICSKQGCKLQIQILHPPTEWFIPVYAPHDQVRSRACLNWSVWNDFWQSQSSIKTIILFLKLPHFERESTLWFIYGVLFLYDQYWWQNYSVKIADVVVPYGDNHKYPDAGGTNPEASRCQPYVTVVTSSEKSLRSECHYSQNCCFRVKTRLELYNSNKWRHVKLYFESCIASLRRFSHVL